MSDIVIRAEGLGKRYLIGHQSSQRESYNALRDVVGRSLKGFGRSALDMIRGRQIVPGDEIEEFWALKDVSFEIKRGEVVGIVGRNGAGKSTLLKILSRITEPSTGRVEIRGRLASLLEVGTGFHPELTGRENIYLNGAILGMSRSEVRAKFDEIIAFAEVEKFLDTPIKRYSSGMYVRLAFAVAAHLEPEILIVDEVLAVGDFEFQKKCLGKMREVSGQGRTVLFVSHNTAAVSTLCSTGILLSKGRSVFNGSIQDVLKHYSSEAPENYDVSFTINDPSRPSIARIKVDQQSLQDRNLKVQIDFQGELPIKLPIGGIVLRGPGGEPVWGSDGRFDPRSSDAELVKCGAITCEALNLPLLPGSYLVSVWLSDGDTDHDSKIDAFKIVIADNSLSHRRPPASVIGHINWPAQWRSTRIVPKSFQS